MQKHVPPYYLSGLYVVFPIQSSVFDVAEAQCVFVKWIKIQDLVLNTLET